jgi:hypothetical protein
MQTRYSFASTKYSIIHEFPSICSFAKDKLQTQLREPSTSFISNALIITDQRKRPGYIIQMGGSTNSLAMTTNPNIEEEFRFIDNAEFTIPSLHNAKVKPTTST